MCMQSRKTGRNIRSGDVFKTWNVNMSERKQKHVIDKLVTSELLPDANKQILQKWDFKSVPCLGNWHWG